MKCPKCKKEVEQTFPTAIGVMCRDCVFTAASAGPGEFTMPTKPEPQLQMFKQIGPIYPAQFLTATAGFLSVANIEAGLVKTMRVGYYDRKENKIVKCATFSCS